MNIDFKQEVNKFRENFFNSKKIILIYLIFILIVTLTMFQVENYLSPFKEVMAIGIVAIFGIFSIVFYSYHNEDNELYKTAFVIIFLLGLLCCFLNPICNVSDEVEHLARADLTSEGILFPQYVNNTFYVSSDISNFFEVSKAKTVFEVEGDTNKINDSLAPYGAVFQQNPFYAYIPQAIGVFLAKILDLNVIWMLWLARIFNLLCYAIIISFAIKKSPILKIPILVMACIPVAIQQAGSVSLDAMLTGGGILIMSYFFYFIKSKDYSISNKQIIIFSIFCLLVGLCRLPYLALIMLLFFVPSNKFESDKSKYIIVVSFIVVGVCGILWTKYALTSYTHSWRSQYYADNNVNSYGQLMYMIDHPLEALVAIFNIPNAFYYSEVLNGFSVLYSNTVGVTSKYRNGFINGLIPLFIGAIWLLYPNPDKFGLREKIGSLFVLIVTYFGICLTQIISWSSVGDLTHIVVHTRYFIPLYVLVPFIFGINNVEERDYKIDSYIITLTISFISAFLIHIIQIFY